MRKLLVLRHAKAERDSSTGRDFDRPLAARGWTDAAEVGRVMRECVTLEKAFQPRPVDDD